MTDIIYRNLMLPLQDGAIWFGDDTVGLEESSIPTTGSVLSPAKALYTGQQLRAFVLSYTGGTLTYVEEDGTFTGTATLIRIALYVNGVFVHNYIYSTALNEYVGGVGRRHRGSGSGSTTGIGIAPVIF